MLESGYEAMTAIPHAAGTDADDQNTRYMLEDLQDRACRPENGMPKGMTLTQFTDYIRGLYPKLYTRVAPTENEE